MKINIVAPHNVERIINNCTPWQFSENHSVSFNGMERQYDAIIVLQSTRSFDLPEMQCKSGNALLIIYEPQDILRLPSSYTKQFDHIVTPNKKICGDNTRHSCFGQLWSMDKSFEEVSSMDWPDTKVDRVSAVISTKCITRGHKARLDFVQELQSELPNEFDWYGKGVREIGDKWDAIYPYKYHLVFENGKWQDYWTEKLTDAFIGYSMPIYIGCPNISDYFSSQSYLSINEISPKNAAEQIRFAIESDLYSQSIDYLSEARDRILNEYGLFPLISSFIEKSFVTRSSEWSHIQFDLFKNTVHRYYPRKAFRKLRHKLRS